MAATSSTDISSMWENFTFDKISLLIQLRYSILHFLGITPIISPIINKLGFSHEITLKIDSDDDFKRFVVKQLDQKLNDLQQLYEEKYNLYEAVVNPESIKADLFSGYISLQNRAYLSNPFSILKVEKYFNLDETGDMELLKKNWNLRYYSRRCSDFNTKEVCFLKAAEYNDLSEYKRLYPLIDKDADIISAVARIAIRGGHIDFLKYIIAQDGKLIKQESPIFNRSFLYEAMVSKYDNVAMIKYLKNNPFDINRVNMTVGDIVILIQYDSHINNIKYILSTIIETLPVDRQVILIVRIMGAIIERGWIDYFKELCSNMMNNNVVEERQINGIITQVLIHGDVELLKYILSFKPISDVFLSYGRLETIVENAKSQDDKTETLEFLSKILRPSSEDLKVIKELDLDGIFANYGSNGRNIKFLLNLLKDYGISDIMMEKYYTSILSNIAELDYSDDYFELFKDIISVYNPSVEEWDKLYYLALSMLNVELAEFIYPYTSKNSNVLIKLFKNDGGRNYGLFDIFETILALPMITKKDIVEFLQTIKQRIHRFDSEDGNNEIVQYILDSGKISSEEVNEILA